MIEPVTIGAIAACVIFLLTGGIIVRAFLAGQRDASAKYERERAEQNADAERIRDRMEQSQDAAVNPGDDLRAGRF